MPITIESVERVIKVILTVDSVFTETEAEIACNKFAENVIKKLNSSKFKFELLGQGYSKYIYSFMFEDNSKNKEERAELLVDIKGCM